MANALLIRNEEGVRLPLPPGEGWGEGPRLPLPPGEGWGEGRLRENPHPAFGHLLPEGEGLARIFPRGHLASAGRSARPARYFRRRGQALVEFALLALVMYLLLAATIDFGRMFFAAQTIQAAADLAAREIARTPLPATLTFDQAMTQQSGQGTYSLPNIYSEDFLAIEIPASVTDVYDYVLNQLNPPMPEVNRLLLPLMYVDTVGDVANNSNDPSDTMGSVDRLLRYPGALVTSQTAPSQFTVMVPLVSGDSVTSVPQITWHRVLEASTSVDSFSITSTSGQRGVVALQVNYPYQAAMMSGFRQNPNGPFEPNVFNPVPADDSTVQQTNAVPNGGMPTAPTRQPGLYGMNYSGQYGLGEQGALAQRVRPFSQFLSSVAISRREVFQ
jgi:TadE-like protein